MRRLSDFLRRVGVAPLAAPVTMAVAAFAAMLAQLLIFRGLIYDINPWMTVSTATLAADVLLMLVPYVWLKPSWRPMVWVAVGLNTIFCYVNLWYCRAFYDLMPVDTLGMAGNLEGDVIDAFFQQLRAADCLLLLPPALLGVMAFVLRRRWCRGAFTLRVGIAVTVVAVLAYAGQYARRAWRLYDVNRSLGYVRVFTGYGKFSAQKAYKFTQQFSYQGYLWYLGAGLWQLLPVDGIDAEARRDIDDFMALRRSEPSAAALYAANRDKNLIFIIVESLASDAVGMRAGGIEVTPTLAALAADSTAIVARHVRFQASHGRSSDGQFIYNTGLLPLRRGVVAKRYPAADYPSIAKALHGRPSAEVVGETPTFYNHSTTSRSYGYRSFYHATTSVWPGDDIILTRADSVARTLAQPFFMTVITLSMHDPYERQVAAPTAISADTTLDYRDRNYLEQVHLFDRRLAGFLDSLRVTGIYDRSVIVIASDHEPRATALGGGLPGDDIFMMIVNAGRGRVIADTVGQVDLFPTVLDVMGVDDYGWRGLGRSLVADQAPHGAVDPSGRCHGVDSPTDSARLERAWRLSETMITGRYFR